MDSGPVLRVDIGFYMEGLFLGAFSLLAPLFLAGFILAQERRKRHLRGEKGPQSAGKKERKKDRSDKYVERK